MNTEPAGWEGKAGDRSVQKFSIYQKSPSWFPNWSSKMTANLPSTWQMLYSHFTQEQQPGLDGQCVIQLSSSMNTAAVFQWGIFREIPSFQIRLEKHQSGYKEAAKHWFRMKWCSKRRLEENSLGDKIWFFGNWGNWAYSLVHKFIKLVLKILSLFVPLLSLKAYPNS